jgi:GH15 family glucan-1,4-alpha-glucosidase
VRDSVLALDALFAVGDPEEAQRYFAWLSSLPERESGRIGVLYSVSGQADLDERELPLAGWRRSRPVRIGNGAADQLQLGTYGTLLHAWHLYERNGLEDVGPEERRVLARTAARAASLWEQPDAGIWEVRSEPRHFTHSKMMCAIGLDSAAALARDLRLDGVDADALERERDRCIRFVEERCVDEATGVYRRAADGEDLDAAVLMALGQGYARWAGSDRVDRTIDALRERLSSDGVILCRYTGEDGVSGREGAFLPCSCWLAGALARAGRPAEAVDVVDGVLERANDVGILSEEVWPDTGELIGNIPQALTHSSLISAAVAVGDALASRTSDGTRLWGPA